MHRSTIGLEMPKSASFTAFRALLPSANYSAEWSGRVWQPAENSNGRLVHFFIWRAANSHYSLQRAPTPDPASLNLKKVRQTAILICSWLLYPTGWAGPISEDLSRRFLFKGRETLWGHDTTIISDEYERVKKAIQPERGPSLSTGGVLQPTSFLEDVVYQ